MEQRLSYAGKRVVVTGAASGIGEATALLVGELGAEVVALDLREVKAPARLAIEVNLAKKRSIDEALARIGEPVDALFNCAGLPGPPFSALETMLVNFVGPRYLAEALAPRMKAGSAIASVSSVASMGYQRKLAALKPLLDTTDYDAARAWCEANPDTASGYSASKECIVAWTQVRAKDLGARGIRINAISPAVTETPMLDHFAAQVGRAWMEEHTRGYLGRNARPDEQAWALAFLNSDAASFISGVNLFVDAGHSGALSVGAAAPPPRPVSPPR